MSIEAMKQALEALKDERDKYLEYSTEDGAPEYIYEAIRSLEFEVAKQAFVEPVQEPFAWCIESEDSADWCFAKTEEGVKSNSVLMDEDCIKTNPFPLYTTPQPQREWVGLTDEDVDYIADEYATLQGAIRAIEAKLKEKNT